MTRWILVTFLSGVFFLSAFPSVLTSGPLDPVASADTVFVDDFERADGPLGSDWREDPTLTIVSGEVEDSDTMDVLDDLAVYVAHTDPLGAVLVWGDSADVEGIDKAGLALMLSDSTTSANGYVVFKNLGTNRYVLRLLENGEMTTRVTTGESDRLYPAAGDSFQVRIRTDVDGHHFDVFYNHELEVTLTDPAKTYGNEETLYSGFVLGGGVENNVDQYTFVRFADDSVPPARIDDLTAVVRSDTSIALYWTATGNDSTDGTARSYEVRYHTEPLTEANWSEASRAMGEPTPSASGSPDSMVVLNLPPDTQYYFGIKASDGFPTANFSELSNVVSGKTLDFVPPSRISDLQVVGVDRRRVRLGWTAPGDTDTLGTAAEYDIRYSIDQITQGNFNQAQEFLGEPAPLPYGTYQEFTTPDLAQEVHYYFAMKTRDENSNWSDMSNVVDTTTATGPETTALDDFERAVLGPWWTADPELALAGGELVNLSDEDRWDFVAIFNVSPNLEEASYVWSESVDPEGTRNAGLVLMMDAPTPDANGYLIFRHDILDKISLWNVENGAPVNQITSVESNLADPAGGDEIRVEISRDASGNHFDYYINGVFDNRLNDPDTTYGGSGDWYAGLMLHSSRNNKIEAFGAAGPTAQVPPSEFFLLEPFDGDTVTVADPRLDWMDALDLNPSDIVYYKLFFGLSPVFEPDSTVAIDSLLESEYTVPPAMIADLAALPGVEASPAVSPAADRDAGRPVHMTAAGSGKRAQGARRAPGSPADPAALPDDVEIFWKVATFDNTGQDTSWSINLDWSFFVRVPDVPNEFDLVSPADGDTVRSDPLEVSFTWHAATDPDPTDTLLTYELTYQKEGGDPVTIEGLTDTTVTTPPLEDRATYSWFVTAMDDGGLARDSETRTFYTRIPSGIEDPGDEAGSLPKVYALAQNYPNPFNPRTTITFDVPEKEADGVDVTLEIFTVRGLKVKTLMQSEHLRPGRHSVQWDGKDAHGVQAGSGVYIYRITAGDFTSIRKMVMVK